MSADFIALLRQASALAVNRPLSADEREAMALGNLMAEQFVSAARSGTLPPDALAYAIAIVAKTGGHGDSSLRGFLQSITEELAP